MTKSNQDEFIPGEGRNCLPIIGGLILFSVILGTTKLGFIPVPTEAKHATTMHLPTIVASLLEGWPVGIIVGTVFGITSMYSAGSPLAQDPLVALVPRMLVGFTPYFVYIGLKGYNDYVRLGMSAVVGTLTNTVFFLGMAVVQGFLGVDQAISIALVHGLPEAMVAIIIVIPAVLILRRGRAFINNLQR